MNNSTNSINSTGDDYSDDYSSDDIIDESDLLMKIFSSISIFSSFCVLLTSLFPHLRNRLYIKIILYLSLSNLLSSLGSVFGYAADKSAACYWEGVATNLFPIASVFWTLKITIILFDIIEYGKISELDYKTHVMCWGFPILVSFLPFINASYGAPDGSGWCFVIPNDPESKMWTTFWYWWVSINNMLPIFQ